MFYFQFTFSFTSDLRNEIIRKHKSDILEGLLRVDPGIADVKNMNNWTLLHYTAGYISSSCAEVLLKLAPHLFDVVETNTNLTPLQFAKKNQSYSIEVITML